MLDATDLASPSESVALRLDDQCPGEGGDSSPRTMASSENRGTRCGCSR